MLIRVLTHVYSLSCLLLCPGNGGTFDNFESRARAFAGHVIRCETTAVVDDNHHLS